MLFANTLRVHSEYGNIALHDLWFGRSILPLLCIKSRVGAASASTTTRRCSASGATSAGPTSCRPTCARPSPRAWRTSTHSWAGRPSASSSAAAGRRTPWSQRGGRGSRYPGEGRRVSTVQGLQKLSTKRHSIALAILLHCILHFDITSQLLEVGVPHTHPRRPLAGSATTGQLSTSGPG